ncbi:hypothetical protein JCGZ_00062 [Jatropha curcas]|uniref:Uncharacterized protein n=1 Tax=Jatropha curcas TaxID=180498 RepID=A0A067LGN0_JATCU|nr:hypothetical protein JCGZ_00062 [Jatropha curcas]
MSGLVVVVSQTGCSSGLWSGEDPEYWRSFLDDRELSDLFLTPWDCKAWRTCPGREVAELHTRSRLLMRGYWADWYFLGERVFDTPWPQHSGGCLMPLLDTCVSWRA